MIFLHFALNYLFKYLHSVPIGRTEWRQAGRYIPLVLPIRIRDTRFVHIHREKPVNIARVGTAGWLMRKAINPWLMRI